MGQFERNSGGGDFEQHIELMLGREETGLRPVSLSLPDGKLLQVFKVGSNRSGRRKGATRRMVPPHVGHWLTSMTKTRASRTAQARR